MTSEAGHAIDMQYFVGRTKNCVRFLDVDQFLFPNQGVF